MDHAQATLSTVAVYLAIGVLFGLLFVVFGVQRIDASARGASPVFRMLILPASIALWPLMAAKWIRARRST